METAAEIAKHYIPCTCDEAYVSRRMIAPDCPLHAFDVESSMEAFSRQVAIDFMEWQRKSPWQAGFVPNQEWFIVKKEQFTFASSEDLFDMYLKETFEKP